jgi:hypothetical protein
VALGAAGTGSGQLWWHVCGRWRHLVPGFVHACHKLVPSGRSWRCWVTRPHPQSGATKHEGCEDSHSSRPTWPRARAHAALRPPFHRASRPCAQKRCAVLLAPASPRAAACMVALPRAAVCMVALPRAAVCMVALPRPAACMVAPAPAHGVVAPSTGGGGTQPPSRGLTVSHHQLQAPAPWGSFLVPAASQRVSMQACQLRSQPVSHPAGQLVSQ